MEGLPEGFKIDPAAYAGLEPEEARRRMDQDTRRAINERPAVRAAVRGPERREAQEQAEEQRAASQREDLAETKFSEDLAGLYRDRLEFYRLKGTPKAVFDKDLWPEIRRRFVAGEEDAVDKERRERASSAY